MDEAGRVAGCGIADPRDHARPYSLEAEAELGWSTHTPPPHPAPRTPRARSKATLARGALLAFTAGVAASMAACDDPAPAPVIEVRSPLAGDVQIGDQRRPVGPLAPARFDALGAGPHTVTFLGPGDPLSIIDAPGPVIDLAPFVDTPPPIDGVIYPLRVRPTAGATVVAVVDGRVLDPVEDDSTLVFRVPDAPTTLVAVWPGDPPRITRRPITSPRREAQDAILLEPRTRLEGELLVAVDATPAAQITAELTEQGLRTGLHVTSGIADLGGALVVPRPITPAAASGLWVIATALDTPDPTDSAGTTGAPARTVETAVRFDHPGVRITWPPQPTIEPPPRAAERALAFDPAYGWSTIPPPGGWTTIELEGRGVCAERRHRIIVPADAPLQIPALPGPDPFAAPLVFARLTPTALAALDLPTLLAAGVHPSELPQWTAQRTTTPVEGYFEIGTEICDPPPLRGAWRVATPDDTCALSTRAPRAVITRCGHFVALGGDRATPLGCGRFTGETDLTYHPIAGGTFAVGRDGDALRVPSPAGAVTLTPVPAPAAIEPATHNGAYTRYSLARQPIDREGRALDDYAVIAGGAADAGPAATLERGVLTVRTPRWTFDSRLIDSDSETATAEADTGGCAERPAELAITWDRDQIIIEGDAADARHRLTLRR